MRHVVSEGFQHVCHRGQGMVVGGALSVECLTYIQAHYVAKDDLVQTPPPPPRITDTCHLPPATYLMEAVLLRAQHMPGNQTARLATSPA